MRYDNQVLFDKGFTTLAYQLEAMMAKAPELEDDFDNLATAIREVVADHEDEVEGAYESGRDEGYSEGYSEAEWGMERNVEDAFEDGQREGYEVGYNEGYDTAFAEAQENIHD